MIDWQARAEQREILNGQLIDDCARLKAERDEIFARLQEATTAHAATAKALTQERDERADGWKRTAEAERDLSELRTRISLYTITLGQLSGERNEVGRHRQATELARQSLDRVVAERDAAQKQAKALRAELDLSAAQVEHWKQGHRVLSTEIERLQGELRRSNEDRQRQADHERKLEERIKGLEQDTATMAEENQRLRADLAAWEAVGAEQAAINAKRREPPAPWKPETEGERKVWARLFTMRIGAGFTAHEAADAATSAMTLAADLGITPAHLIEGL